MANDTSKSFASFKDAALCPACTIHVTVPRLVHNRKTYTAQQIADNERLRAEIWKRVTKTADGEQVAEDLLKQHTGIFRVEYEVPADAAADATADETAAKKKGGKAEA